MICVRNTKLEQDRTGLNQSTQNDQFRSDIGIENQV